MDDYQSFTLLGIALISLGAMLVILPFIVRNVPSLKQLPWVILWVYKRNGFFFATSPILIVITVVSLILGYLKNQ